MNEWGGRLSKAVVWLAVAGVLWFAPDGAPGSVLRYKHGVLTFLAIVFIGKAIYNTLYWDRYLGHGLSPQPASHRHIPHRWMR